MEDRINEKIIRNKEIIPIDKELIDVYKSICKIILPDNPYNILGTGFLMKLEKNNSPLLCLIIPNHIITQEIIDSIK